MFCILVTQKSFVSRYSPVNSEGLIQDVDAAICLWSIEVVAFVLEDCCHAEDSKAMGEALGDENVAMVVFSEFNSNMMPIGRATFTNIYCHIEDCSPDAAHQFALGVGRALEVESAEHAIAAAGVVVLHEVDVQPCLLPEFLGVETLEEISPGVPEDLRLDYERAFYVGFNYFHFLT